MVNEKTKYELIHEFKKRKLTIKIYDKSIVKKFKWYKKISLTYNKETKAFKLFFNRVIITLMKLKKEDRTGERLGDKNIDEMFKTQNRI